MKPPPLKADQWGIVWVNLPVYLTYDPAQEINAAAALLKLELHFPVEGYDARRGAPLFCDNAWKPLTGSFLDKYIVAALTIVKSPIKYSWHSFRASLACRLLASGATNPQIQALCRWQSEESLRIYAKMAHKDYYGLLQNAYAKEFDQIQFSSIARYTDISMAQALNSFELSSSHDQS